MFTQFFQPSFFVAMVMLLAWLPGSSYAQAVPAPGSFESFMWAATGGTSSSSQILSFTKSGSPVLSPIVPQIDTDGGLPRVLAGGQLKNPAGNPFAVSAAGRISALQTAKAVGRVALGFTGFLGVGVALYDLFKELGYDAQRLPDGTLKVSKSDPSICSQAPCYHYRHFAGGTYLSYYPSLQASCSAAPGDMNAYSGAGATWIYDTAQLLPDGRCIVEAYVSWQSTNRTSNTLNPQSIAVSPRPNLQPSSSQEFIDAVAAKSGWPSSSAIARVLAEPAATTAAEKIPVESVTASGPATSPGVVKTTVTTLPDGSTVTTTETTDYKHAYSGPNVSTTTSTTTNVQTCTGAGACSTTSSTVRSEPAPTAPEPVPTCGMPGAPECAVKVSEAGMPTDLPVTKYQPSVDTTQAAKDSGLRRLASPADSSSLFTGWSAFFGTPALATCSPIVLPDYHGVSMGSLDPCPVVNGMREVMAYLWAAGGLFLCLGMIRQTVQLG